MGNIDGISFPSESEDLGLDEDVIQRARRTVAANAKDVDDARLILSALGIHPAQPDLFPEEMVGPPATPPRVLRTFDMRDMP
jgi:hypothetical protein